MKTIAQSLDLLKAAAARRKPSRTPALVALFTDHHSRTDYWITSAAYVSVSVEVEPIFT